MIFKETARVSQQEQVMSNINPLFMTTSIEPQQDITLTGVYICSQPEIRTPYYSRSDT